MAFHATRFTGPLRASCLAFTALVVVSGCSDDDPVAPDPSFDASPILAHVSTSVITATYEDLRVAAVALDAAVSTLAASTTEDNLAAARQAWREARIHWERSESFLFGPVSTEGIDPAMDSWPVNTVDLDAVLASSNELTVEFIDGLEGTLKGFHTIEYLLFGTSGAQPASELTERELEYLEGASGSLANATANLADAWSPSGENFAGQLANAGSSGSIYASEKAGVQELVTGMITIADEVANGKINDPFVAGDPTLEESAFLCELDRGFPRQSARAAEHLRGDAPGGAGPGVSDVVVAFDAEPDVALRSEIDAAISAIGAIPAAVFECHLHRWPGNRGCAKRCPSCAADPGGGRDAAPREPLSASSLLCASACPDGHRNPRSGYGCGDNSSGPVPTGEYADEMFAGGDMTVFEASSNAFALPAPNLLARDVGRTHRRRRGL